MIETLAYLATGIAVVGAIVTGTIALILRHKIRTGTFVPPHARGRDRPEGSETPHPLRHLGS